MTLPTPEPIKRVSKSSAFFFFFFFCKNGPISAHRPAHRAVSVTCPNRLNYQTVKQPTPRPTCGKFFVELTVTEFRTKPCCTTQEYHLSLIMCTHRNAIATHVLLSAYLLILANFTTKSFLGEKQRYHSHVLNRCGFLFAEAR